MRFRTDATLALACLLVWLPLPGRAQYDMTHRFPSGIVLGPSTGRTANDVRWVTAEGHLVGRDPRSGALECWDVGEGTADLGTRTGVRLDLPTPADPAGEVWNASVVATGRVEDGVVLFALRQDRARARLMRAHCATGATVLSTIDVDPAALVSSTIVSWLSLPGVGTDTVWLAAAGSSGGQIDQILRLQFTGPAPGARVTADRTNLAGVLEPLLPADGTSPLGTGYWHVVTGAAVPDGRAFFVVRRRTSVFSETALVEVAPDGTITPRFGPRAGALTPPPLESSPLTSMLYDPVRDLVLLDRVSIQRSLGVDAVHRVSLLAGFSPTRSGWTDEVVPMGLSWSERTSEGSFDVAPDALVGSASGAIFGRFEHRVRRLDMDDGRADFDRDGLSRLQEAAAGLSDADDDCDDDGANDGIEVEHLRTDPLDAMDSPPTVVRRHGLAPSTMIHRWALPWHDTTSYGEVATAGAVYCWTRVSLADELFDEWECRAADGRLVTHGTVVSRPMFTDDLSHYFYVDREHREIRRVTVATGEEALYAMVPEVSTVNQPHLLRAFGPEQILVAAGETGDAQKLWLTPGDGADHLLFDRARSGCPLATAAELARCGEADLARPVSYVEPLGTDPESGALVAILRIRDSAGGEIVAITPERVAHLADADDVSPLTPVFAGAGRALDGRWLVHADGARLFDGAFRPLPERQPLIGSHLGQWLGEGLGAQLTYGYQTVEMPVSGTGGCVSVGGVTLCVFDPSAGPPEILQLSSTERALLVPVPDGVESGEVIFSGTGGDRATPPPATRARTGPYPFGGRGLFRLTRLGGVSPWLDIDDLISLGDAPLRASLEAATLADIDDLGVASDGEGATAVCLVERAIGRGIEIHLDPGSHVEASARLLAPGARGCAYTADGTLAVLLDDEVDVGGARLAIEVPSPRLLEQVSGRFLVVGAEGQAECVAMDGTRSDVATQLHTVSAMEPEGLVAIIQLDGHGYVARVEELCGGIAPSEALVSDESLSFLDRLTALNFPYRLPPEIGGHVTIRPDGLAVGNVWFPEPGSGVTLEPALYVNEGLATALHGFEPHYVPADPATRVRALDDWRRVPRTDDGYRDAAWPLAYTPTGGGRLWGSPSRVRASTLVRGGVVADAWTHRGLTPPERPDYDTPTTGDAGRADAGHAPSPDAPGCICASGRSAPRGGAAILALVVIGLVARRGHRARRHP